MNNYIKNVFLSILIPVYNEEQYLPLLLDDLSNQVYRNFEVIIIDGKSEDNTLLYLNKYQDLLPRMKVLSSERRNAAYQRNLGVTQAEYKMLVFIDADVRLKDPLLLDKLASEISKSETELFMLWWNPIPTKIKYWILSIFLMFQVEILRIFKFPTAYGSFIGCSKDVFNQIGGFNEDLHFMEDTDFVKKASKKTKYHIIRSIKYFMNFRRYEEKGYIKTTLSYAFLILRNFSKKKVDATMYPMGGSY